MVRWLRTPSGRQGTPCVSFTRKMPACHCLGGVVCSGRQRAGRRRRMACWAARPETARGHEFDRRGGRAPEGAPESCPTNDGYDRGLLGPRDLAARSQRQCRRSVLTLNQARVRSIPPWCVHLSRGKADRVPSGLLAQHVVPPGDAFICFGAS